MRKKAAQLGRIRIGWLHSEDRGSCCLYLKTTYRLLLCREGGCALVSKLPQQWDCRQLQPYCQVTI